jgi:TBC domain-containing protein kinase-like protein
MFGVTTRQTRVTSKSKLGIQSFYGSNKSTDFHSTQRILGKFKELPRHPYLTEYVYATSTPLQQMILVQSLFTDRLIDAEPLKEYIVQMVVALSYLNDLGIVCGTLSESTVFLSENTIKISNWGLFHMVHGGNVDFPVIHPRYLSPESHVGIYYKQDVWSLGILLLDWVLKRDLNGMAIDGFFDKEELHAVPEQGIPPLLRDFILDCLNPDHKNRPQIQGLLLHPFLEDVVFPELWKKSPFIAPKQDLSLETFMPTHGQLLELWKLLGNDLEKECKSSSNKPAIFTIPTVVKTSDEVQQLVSQLQGRPPFDDQLKQINLEPVFDRIHLIKTDSKMFDSILATYNDEWKRQIEWKLENIEAIWENYALKPSQLYAVEKERDFNYQFARWYQFAELLQRFPHSLALIRKEASVDIPPILRGLIWGALLEIKGDPRIDYEMYSTEAEHPTDRQLDLDIPRCHQVHFIDFSIFRYWQHHRVIKN